MLHLHIYECTFQSTHIHTQQLIQDFEGGGESDVLDIFTFDVLDN